MFNTYETKYISDKRTEFLNKSVTVAWFMQPRKRWKLVENSKQVEAVAYFKVLPNSPGDTEDFYHSLTRLLRVHMLKHTVLSLW